ncbi:box C D snoRNA 1 isoform X2 [Brachionus plicatilis]|uniref:Box C D snoRNA 1 isoform X2 n=1 Tax=Brachionus plicatilis TaxID=10195 RepID=A0A3M7P7N9_BRAPC|nr:box C D snoRNA 1 isoform X2 [Brachionus plicatilis]
MTSSLAEHGSIEVPSSSKLENPCELCHNVKSKYKCPACGIKTCSLECCRTHKENTGCTGQRDKTKFVSKEEFSENILINDYRFLEEQSRIIDAYQRASELGEEHILSGKTLSSPSLENDPSKNLQFYGTYENLRKFVHKQSNICLKLMPPQSTRHVNNKTRFNRARNMVSWSLEFVFHLSKLDEKYFRFDTKKVLFSSKETLESCLKYFYEKFQMNLFDLSALKYEKNEVKANKINLLIEQYRDIFQNQDFDKLNVLFEIKDLKEQKIFYLKFNLNQTLEDCLENQTLIEYPSFFLVKKENLADYEIIEQKKQNSQINDLDVRGNQLNENNEEGEVEASDNSGSDDEYEHDSKKIRLDDTFEANLDQNDDQSNNDRSGESSELEEGEERD